MTFDNSPAKEIAKISPGNVLEGKGEEFPCLEDSSMLLHLSFCGDCCYSVEG